MNGDAHVFFNIPYAEQLTQDTAFDLPQEISSAEAFHKVILIFTVKDF